MKVRVMFEPRDMWIGLYWKRFKCSIGTYWDFYICIIPMLPICIHIAPKLPEGDAGNE